MTEAQAAAPAAGQTENERRSWTFLICLGAVLVGSLVVAGLNLLYWYRMSPASRAMAMTVTNTIWGFVAVFVLLAAIGRVWVLMRRELIAYFRSPLFYILALFFNVLILLIVGWRNLDAGPKAIVPGLIFWSFIIMIVVVPILTMRLLAQEKDAQTMEILVTDPVTDWDIVLGKYLAAVLTLWAMLLPLGIYVICYALIGKPDVPWYKVWEWLPASLEWGPVVTSFTGLALLGALFAAVGLFASSLTSNQAISALLGIAMVFVLSALGLLEIFFTSGKAHDFIESLSLFARLRSMMEGRFDTRTVFLYLSTAALMLYLTVKVTESRKWR
jgi:ABC-2 type transport system permease protein